MTAGRPRPYNAPRRTDPCLCGSGRTFRECCREHLPGHEMNKRWREPARKDQWLAVLRAVRADLTQYSIYHRTNTVPLMRVLPPEENKILAIDIDAMNDCVEHMASVYSRLAKLAEFPAVLERLRVNIDDPRWQRKITYQQAMTAHLLDDVVGARRDLAKLGPITPAEGDIALLQLHIDVNGDTIALVDKLALFDRILALAASRQERIQYSSAKAIELSLAGDAKGASATVDGALAEARISEEESPFGPDVEIWFCMLLEVAGIANADDSLFVESARRLRCLVAAPDYWTLAGQGHLNRCLGDVLRLSGQWKDAAAAYAEGFALEANPACRIFEASCYLMQDLKGDALALIETIAFDELDLAEQADYAIAYAAIAIALRDLDRLDDAATKLKRVKPMRQHFVLDNMRYQLAIERARATIAAGKPVPKSGRLLDWIGSLSRWFMVQPNVAGIGINFNAIADDAIAARRRMRKQKPNDAD